MTQGDPPSTDALPMADARADQAQRQFELKMRVGSSLKRIRHIVCVMSGKGGVGKSTVAVNLAVALADGGLEVGLADFDLTNPNTPTMLGLGGGHLEAVDEGTVSPLQARDRLRVVSTGFLVESETPIAWRGPIKTGVMRQFIADVAWGDLDVLVVDLPPGTSDEALSVAQTFPHGTPCILVTTPQETSVENVRQNLRFCQETGLTVLGVIANFAGLTCPHCGEEVHPFPGHGIDDLAKALGAEVLARLPLEPSVGKGQDSGTPAVEIPDSIVGVELRRVASDLAQSWR